MSHETPYEPDRPQPVVPTHRADADTSTAGIPRMHTPVPPHRHAVSAAQPASPPVTAIGPRFPEPPLWAHDVGAAGPGAPPPPYAPAPFAAAPPPGHGDGPHRRRVPRALAGLVGAAVIAAGVGGLSGYLAADHTATAPTATAVRPSAAVENAANQSGGSFDAETLAATALPSVVTITERTSTLEGIGSGIILSSDGMILTNNHVIEDANAGNGSVTVTFSNGRTAPAQIVGTDAAMDLAVIRAEGVSGLTPATLGDSSAVRPGQQVVAIGAPEGLSGTVTEGIVSAVGREVSVQEGGSSGGYGAYPWGRGFGGGGGFGNSSATGPTTVTIKDAIQTDAAINPGNSGGPLLNSSGEVIGINFAIYSSDSSSGSEGGNQGIGFTIPINDAKSVISQLENGATI